MCSFNFILFLSAFQLFPTAPFRIRDLGGSKLAAGLFVGFLTYASAFSAPLTGALADRLGRVRTLIICSFGITLVALGYLWTTRTGPMLALVVVHGIFWSGLLTSASAQAIELMPPSRRAEGLGYFSLSMLLGVIAAPAIGLWVYRHGWHWLCLDIIILMLITVAIATRIEPTPRDPSAVHAPILSRHAIEWRIFLGALTMFLAAFGYGGVMSFAGLYAEQHGVWPSLYFTVFAGVMMFSRPIAGKLADRLGSTRVLIPCLILGSIGYALLAVDGTLPWIVASAVVLGLGWGSAPPAFAAYMLRGVDDQKRAAAFGGYLAAMDTGIGTGSIAIGWIIQHRGYSAAYATASVIATLSWPYFWFIGRRLLTRGT